MTAAVIASGTLTSDANGVTISQTWNNSGVTFSGALKVSITNTASGSSSRIVDFQVGGSTYMSLGFSNPATSSGPTWYGNGGSPYIQLSQSNGTTVGYSTNTQTLWGTTRIESVISGTATAAILASHSRVASGVTRSWSSDSSPTGTPDTSLSRIAAAVLGVRGSSTSVGAALNFLEQTAPSAPSSNQVVLYAEDNGSGKTRLMALFPTGAAQQVAIEP